MDTKGHLVSLHEALVQTMLEELALYKKEQIPIPAADKQAIIALLKHNDIVAGELDKDKLDSLKEDLKSDRAARKSNISGAIAKARVTDLSMYKQSN